MTIVLGWLLNAGYVLLIVVISPVLFYRRLVQGKYRRGWSEKLTGRLTRRHPDRPCVWLHAVSVGEVVQLGRVIEEIKSTLPEAELLISTTTETGFDVAQSKFGQHTISFFPLDFTWAVHRALESIRPDLIVLVELELWPNFILTAHRKKIPIALINGRIGEKSFRGYRRIRSLMKHILNRLSFIGVQNATYRERLSELGATDDRLFITGNIKFDGVDVSQQKERILELRNAFRISHDDIVFIAGSTQAPEERYAVDSYLELRNEFPGLRLIVVPRHKERFEAVAEEISARQLPLIRRSQPDKTNSIQLTDSPILLLDTLGELAACWGLSDIAFVGGSLTNRGGQNMLEPAAFGAAILFGPNTWNFRDITEALLERNGAIVVRGPDELTSTIRSLLKDRKAAIRMGEIARSFVESQKGATERTVDRLIQLLKR